MKIAVIGTGYVGLTIGAVFARFGHHVKCVDIDEKKVEMLNAGEVPIYEPGLKELIQNRDGDRRISFTTDMRFALQASDVYFIAVGTPQDDEGSFNLKYVHDVAASIGKALMDMDSYKVIVIKSTVPPGTNAEVDRIIRENKISGTAKFDVVSNPEFLKEGKAIKDFASPDRIVIGTESEDARAVMERLYHPFAIKRDKLIFMKPINAELTKIMANACLATKISFINESANICDAFGGDISEVREGLCSDSRIGWEFYYPSVGYGGSCFPKDIRGLLSASAVHGYKPRLLKAVDDVNDDQKIYLAKSIEKFFEDKGGLTGKTIAIWGLAFKPRTDDIRESAAIYIIKYLLEKGASIKAFDPKAMDNMKRLFPEKVTFSQSKYDALKGADALALVTEWDAFKAPDLEEIKATLKIPVIFDGRNIYDPTIVKSKGFSYFGIGRR